MLLRDDRPVVGVKQGAQFVGVLTPNGVHRALRESLRAATIVPGCRVNRLGPQ